ncbi:MAG TPA: lysylphosphatidylglycerol synthase transmembrane domain-containing protein [Candidatus Acidoferrum sp.]|nr:lysylphosphatidylglycerol synthase transmembrane domain-containing protein [Candidatus Acidoferrum sp.]
MPHPLLRILWGSIRFLIGVGLLAFLARSGIVDLETLKRLSQTWHITLAAVALMGVDVLMMSLRLSWLLRSHGLHLPLGKSLQLTFVSFFFTAFLPGSAGGALAKLFYAAKENAGRRTEIATVVIFDRAIGLFSLLILALVFVPFFPRLIAEVTALRILVLITAILVAGLLVSLFVCLFDGSRPNRFLRNILGFLPWSDLAERAMETIGFYRRSPTTLLSALGASLLANFSVVVVAALAVLALHPAYFSLKMCLVIPLGYIANSLPLTPGGLGVGESAFNSLFKLTGLGGGADALLCWRIWSLPIVILGFVFYLRGLGRSVHRLESDAPQQA